MKRGMMTRGRGRKYGLPAEVSNLSYSNTFDTGTTIDSEYWSGATNSVSAGSFALADGSLAFSYDITGSFDYRFLIQRENWSSTTNRIYFGVTGSGGSRYMYRDPVGGGGHRVTSTDGTTYHYSNDATDPLWFRLYRSGSGNIVAYWSNNGGSSWNVRGTYSNISGDPWLKPYITSLGPHTSRCLEVTLTADSAQLR